MTRPQPTAVRTLTLEGFDPVARRSSILTFTGRLLGESTSHAARHAVPLVHDEGSFAPPGTRCSACRWFEVRIWAVIAPEPPMRVSHTKIEPTAPAESPVTPSPTSDAIGPERSIEPVPTSSAPTAPAENRPTKPTNPPGGASSPVSEDASTESGTDLGWVVETVGRSTVPRESDRRQFRHVTEPRGVVATLVQSKPRLDGGGNRIGDDDDVFIPATSRRALDLAAEADPRLASVIDRLLVFD